MKFYFTNGVPSDNVTTCQITNVHTDTNTQSKETHMSMRKGDKLTTNEIDRLRTMFSQQRTNAVDLVTRLREERERQADFIADTRTLRMVPINDEMSAALPEIPQSERTQPVKPRVAIVPVNDQEEWYNAIGPVAANAHAHSQIGATLQIPRPYYQRMLEEQPDLLAHNVNTWFDKNPAQRMVRTMSTNGGGPKMAFARGFLSNKYRRLDAVDLADTIMPMFLDERSDWQVTQCGVTDLRVHIEARFPTIAGEVVVGDEVSLAVKITTSDVGAGALSIQFGVYRIVCTNLMTVPNFTKRQIHIGGSQSELVQVLSDRTLRAEDRLTMRKMKELVASMANHEQFNTILSTLRNAAEVKVEDPVAATELLTANLRLKDYENHEIQKALMADTSAPTIWSLGNALTSTARTFEFERKAELEAAAGTLMSNPKMWKQYAEAAA